MGGGLEGGGVVVSGGRIGLALFGRFVGDVESAAGCEIPERFGKGEQSIHERPVRGLFGLAGVWAWRTVGVAGVGWRVDGMGRVD